MELEEFKECIRVGRPLKYDRREYAIKLLDWAMKPESLNLNQFCADNFIPHCYISKWAHENKEFNNAYQAVLQKLAYRREQALREGKLHVKAYDLNIKVYDKVKRDSDREEIEYELRLKKELEKEDKQKIDGRLIELLDSLRDQEKNKING